MIPFELTDKDHLRWYVNGHLYGDRYNDRDTFDVQLGKVNSESVKDFRTELYAAMAKLIDTHGTKLDVFYSGGADSEVVLRVLLDLGVRPKVYTIRFIDGSNAHETDNAAEFCLQTGLEQIRIERDIERYIKEKQYLDLATKYQCSQIAYLNVVDSALSFCSGPVIMGGEVYLQKHQSLGPAVQTPEEWYYIYRENEDAFTYRVSHGTRLPIINEVFTYTPELLYSYLTDPMVAEVARNEVPGKITLLSIKRKVYEKHLGCTLLAQTKYHGYESMLWTNKVITDDLKKHWPKQQAARLEYHKLLEDMACK